MKKKILFIMPSMFIGGAERSLLGLLDSFDYEKWEVYLFLYRHEGEFYKYIPEQVCILPPMKEYGTFDTPIKSILFGPQILFGMARIIGKIKKQVHCFLSKEESGVWMSMQYISRTLIPLLPNIPGEYEVAISFLGVPDVLVYKTKAKKKLAWNHTDYSILGPDKSYDRKLYSQVDYIASVSEACSKKFVAEYPDLKNKSITIQNIISKRLLIEQAMERIEDFPPHSDSEYHLLSIGRFSDAKNFDNVPEICKIIREQGLNIKWYIIGYGTDEQLIRDRIRENQMEKHVIILGKKENPYPYIKECDLYIQPSRYEGKCVSVLEAQLLGKPVVITNYETSGSQLIDGQDGIIIPMNNTDAANALASIIRDRKLQEFLSKNTQKNDYTNKTEIEKIYELVE